MNRQVMVLGVLAVAAQAISAWAGEVTVVTTLPAQVGTNFKSNIDLSGAVGLQHIVSFNGGGVVVYDKTSGKVIERLSQSEFWNEKVAASYSMDPEAKYNDPKLIEDGVLLQEGFIDDPKCDYLYPSLALDRAGNLGIGCSRVSQTEYPSVYVMMHAATDPPNTMRPPVLAVPGTTAYTWGTSNPAWCHYSSTCVDPSDPHLLWTCQPFSASQIDKEWCTAWVAFKLSIDPALHPGTVLTSESSPAESEAFTGTAARTGTFKRPLLIVDGQRHELQASDKADASVAAMLAKFSDGDTGTYIVQGTRGTVNRGDGIIIDSITPAADSSNRPSPAASPPAGLLYQYDTYDYAETAARGIIKRYRLAIPKNLTTVKGILVVSNCAGGDSRDWYTNGTSYEPFINLHDFAFVGGTRDCSHFEAYEAFVKALSVWAEASGHPELIHVPYVTTGLSAGGGFASTLVTKCPEKVIAAVIQCSRLNLTVFTLPKYISAPVPVPDAVLRTPVLSVTGETENLASVLTPPLESYRPVGALFGWAEIPGRGHEYCGQEVIAMPYLEAALKLRYPSTGDVRGAPLKLKQLDPMSGWIADNTTWKSGLTRICPARQFTGDLKQSSWLMNQDLAYIYRAYATYDRPLRITLPGQDNIYSPIQAAGSSLTIPVDASKFPDWKKLEFYDGAMLLGSITSGSPEYEATNLTPGFHTFSVLGTDPSGNVRPSNCAMVAVHK